MKNGMNYIKKALIASMIFVTILYVTISTTFDEKGPVDIGLIYNNSLNC